LYEQQAARKGADTPPNHARFVFLDERSAELYPDWDKAAADTVAGLRAEAGRNPTDRRLDELLGELSHSERFRTLWVSHDVRWHSSGTKRFRHRIVGDLALAYEALELPDDPGQALITFTAEPGSPSAEALGFLASWASFSHTEVPERARRGA
jgi:hypothetical protein